MATTPSPVVEAIADPAVSDSAPVTTPSATVAPVVSAPDFSAIASAAPAASSNFGLAAIGGYIEPATVRNRFRVSWSDFKRSNAPDRAQYFYGYADSSVITIPAVGIGFGAGVSGEGPDYNALLTSGNIVEPSFEEVHVYLEHVIYNNDISFFIDVPFRITSGFNFNDPNVSRFDGFEGDGGDTGIGDLQLGLRFSLVETCDFALSGILKGYIPTGNPRLAHGTGHGSIEFGFLFQKQYGENLTLFGQLTDWISLDDTLQEPAISGDSNVLQYGLGIGYKLYDGCYGGRSLTVTPVAEFVGWSVLDGITHRLDVAANAFSVEDADGDVIINGKYGARVGMGQSSIYAGYGHNLTDEHWYREIVRVEYTRRF